VLPHLRERMSTAELTDIGQRFLVARAEHLGDQPDDMTKRTWSSRPPTSTWRAPP